VPKPIPIDATPIAYSQSSLPYKPFPDRGTAYHHAYPGGPYATQNPISQIQLARRMDKACGDKAERGDACPYCHYPPGSHPVDQPPADQAAQRVHQDVY